MEGTKRMAGLDVAAKGRSKAGVICTEMTIEGRTTRHEFRVLCRPIEWGEHITLTRRQL